MQERVVREEERAPCTRLRSLDLGLQGGMRLLQEAG